jgi:hypothetical protein
MTAQRHRGAHSSTPSRPWPLRTLVGLVGAAAVVMTFLGVRAVAGGNGEPAGTPAFTGVVTDFADDGALMCVRREGAGGGQFCDLFFIAPGTPRIDVGDRVFVRTISSNDEHGRPVAGMLVDPLP